VKDGEFVLEAGACTFFVESGATFRKVVYKVPLGEDTHTIEDTTSGSDNERD